jgi:hypothetical protein
MSTFEKTGRGEINSNGNKFTPIQPRWLPSRTIVAADWPGPRAAGLGLEGGSNGPGGPLTTNGTTDRPQLPEIVRLIIEGPVAWTRVPPWVDPIDEEWKDMVEKWKRDDGTYYTLNQRGADYVGVYLVELTPRQMRVARGFGLAASEDEPTLMRWAWRGDRGPVPRAEPEWKDRRVQPKLVNMDFVLPKCIKWQPNCLDGAVRAAGRAEREQREAREDGVQTRMERVAGAIRKANGVADRKA